MNNSNDNLPTRLSDALVELDLLHGTEARLELLAQIDQAAFDADDIAAQLTAPSVNRHAVEIRELHRLLGKVIDAHGDAEHAAVVRIFIGLVTERADEFDTLARWAEGIEAPVETELRVNPARLRNLVTEALKQIDDLEKRAVLMGAIREHGVNVTRSIDDDNRIDVTVNGTGFVSVAAGYLEDSDGVTGGVSTPDGFRK